MLFNQYPRFERFILAYMAFFSTAVIQWSVQFVSDDKQKSDWHKLLFKVTTIQWGPVYGSGAPPWCSGSVLDYISLPPVFESLRGHMWRVFHLWLRFITFGGRSAHLAYLVHKSGRNTPIIIICTVLTVV